MGVRSTHGTDCESIFYCLSATFRYKPILNTVDSGSGLGQGVWFEVLFIEHLT